MSFDAGSAFDALVLPRSKAGTRLPFHRYSKPQEEYAERWAASVCEEFRYEAAEGVKELQQRAGPRHDFTVIHRHPTGDGATSVVTVAVPGRFGDEDKPVPVVRSDEEDSSGPRIVFEMLYAQQAAIKGRDKPGPGEPSAVVFFILAQSPTLAMGFTARAYHVKWASDPGKSASGKGKGRSKSLRQARKRRNRRNPRQRERQKQRNPPNPGAENGEHLSRLL